jgi:Predicted membrane protein (DUF2232)
MKFETKSIAIGVAAGLAAALLSVGSAVPGALSFLLFFAAPLPVMTAGLGWGPAAALAACVTAFAAISGFASLLPALVLALTITLPSALMAYFASLAQTDADGRLVWFPLSGVFFRGVLAVAVGFVAAGVLVGFTPEFAGIIADEILKQFTAADPKMVIPEATRARLALNLATLIPYVQPASWLLVLLLNFYAALHLSRLSGQLKRPRDYWPSELRLPKIALPVMAICLALSFIGGAPGSIAAVPAGALLMGFSVCGLAVFHKFTAAKTWRRPGLWLTYIALALMGFLIIPFLIAGVLTTARGEPSPNPQKDT